VVLPNRQSLHRKTLAHDPEAVMQSSRELGSDLAVKCRVLLPFASRRNFVVCMHLRASEDGSSS
jgi:hypothetical protein